MKPTVKRLTGQNERRKYRRYIVRGRIRFSIDSLEVWGELVNFGEGGLLIRSLFDLPVGTRLDLRIMAFGYPVALDGVGQVVGSRGNLLAIQFVERSPEAGYFLRWLEVEHYPWTGTFDDPDVKKREDVERYQAMHQAMRQAASPAWEARETAHIERIEEEIFQRA